MCGVVRGIAMHQLLDCPIKPHDVNLAVLLHFLGAQCRCSSLRTMWKLRYEFAGTRDECVSAPSVTRLGVRWSGSQFGLRAAQVSQASVA